MVKNNSTEAELIKNIQQLAAPSPAQMMMTARTDGVFPSVDAVKEILTVVKSIVFPDFFDRHSNRSSIRSYCIGVGVEKIFSMLAREISHAFLFERRESRCDETLKAEQRAIDFIGMLPEIKRLLYTDVEAIYNNDPAVDNYGEIILCYPVVITMVHYRVAHALSQLKIPILPRIITELAHSATGIDIHPGAEIGEYFAIDHGTGVVIGETCIIGNHVTLYQGVTLGAKNFSLDSNGHPMNVPRHPIIEDNVTIYSNSSILGRITVGHDSIIGGNVWLTNSVPPGSRILQRRAMEMTFTDGLGI